MKLIVVVVLTVVAVAWAAVDEPAKILRADYERKSEGGYAFGFDTENGISRNENGELKEALDEDKKPHQVIVVKGSYSYTDNEGKVETINYVADENGYQAEGDSIPKPVSRR